MQKKKLETIERAKFSLGSNSKLGPKIASINRVPIETCPGKSDWCERNCYATRGAFSLWFNEYGTDMEIPDLMPSVVRFHGSGDFDSVEYIEKCISLVRAYPRVRFYAYTRSWRVDSLLEELEKLRAEENMQLFASMDSTIREKPPEGWRVSWIENDKRAKGTFCPHDAGNVDNCGECGICYNDHDTDVTFKVK